MPDSFAFLEKQRRQMAQRCPFCFHYARKTHKREEADNDYWTVVCLNCAAEGPLSATEKGAEKLWANRTHRHVFSIERDDKGSAACVCSVEEGELK